MDGEPLDVLEQRLRVVGHPARLGDPVVHFEIDVAVIVGLPRRIEVFVPLALDVRGQLAIGRRRAQEVAAEVEVEQRKRRIGFAIADAPHPHVGREVGLVEREVEVEGAVVAGVLFDVLLEEVRPDGRFRQPPHRAFRLGLLPGRRRADVDGDDDLGRACDEDLARVNHAGRAARVPHVRLDAELDAVLYVAVHRQRGIGRGEREGAVKIVVAVEPDGAVERLALAGDAHKDDVFRQVGDVLAGDNLARAVCDGNGRVLHVEFAVVAGGAVVIQLEVEIASGLVGIDAGDAEFHRAERVVAGLRALIVLAGKEQLADLGQEVGGLLVVAVAVRPFPEPFVVERNSLAFVRTHHHRGKPAGADGQPLQPVAGGARVPELVMCVSGCVLAHLQTSRLLSRSRTGTMIRRV